MPSEKPTKLACLDFAGIDEYQGPAYRREIVLVSRDQASVRAKMIADIKSYAMDHEAWGGI